MSSRATRATPFCKVCFDSGRPSADYTSHYVKDSPGPDGRVVCPVLLAQECRYCKEKGHTPTHCPKLADKYTSHNLVNRREISSTTRQGWTHTTPDKKQTRTRVEAPGAPLRVKKAATTTTANENRFAALLAQIDSDSDTEDNTADVCKTLFVAEGPRAVEEVKKPILTGWAALAAKPAVGKVVERADIAQVTPKKDKITRGLILQDVDSWTAPSIRRWGDDDSDSDLE